MSNTTDHPDAVVYITKINGLVADGRDDLIAAIIADYERGADPVARRGGTLGPAPFRQACAQLTVDPADG